MNHILLLHSFITRSSLAISCESSNAKELALTLKQVDVSSNTQCILDISISRSTIHTPHSRDIQSCRFHARSILRSQFVDCNAILVIFHERHRVSLERIFFLPAPLYRTYPITWNKLHACAVHAICIVSTATMMVIPTVIMIVVYKNITTKYLFWSIPYSAYTAKCRGRDSLRGSTISRSIGPSEGIVINIDIITYINTANLSILYIILLIIFLYSVFYKVYRSLYICISIHIHIHNLFFL